MFCWISSDNWRSNFLHKTFAYITEKYSTVFLPYIYTLFTYYAYSAEFMLKRTKFLSSKSLECSFSIFSFFLVGLIASAIFSTKN